MPPEPAHVVAIYPGSFDPVTFGHLDIIGRATRIFDRLIVAVLQNENKQSLFSVDERMEMLREVLLPPAGKQNPAEVARIEIASFDGLLVNYAAQRGARVILRGIRAISDYEYELQMALMNRKLASRIETVFLMAEETQSFVSSRLVKEVARLGGDVSAFVPASIEARLRERLSRPRPLREAAR